MKRLLLGVVLLALASGIVVLGYALAVGLSPYSGADSKRPEIGEIKIEFRGPFIPANSEELPSALKEG